MNYKAKIIELEAHHKDLQTRHTTPRNAFIIRENIILTEKIIQILKYKLMRIR